MIPLAVVLLTYQRTEYALRTVQTAVNNLRYEGSVQWYIADDGSDGAHVKALVDEIEMTAYMPEPLDWHSEKQGYGANANAAAQLLSDDYPVTLWLEDDWALTRPFNLTPYVHLLETNHDVGMVRLGHMPVGQHMDSVGYDGHMYLNIHKSQQYAYSGNPHLKHRRFFEQHGGWPEGLDPGKTELAYDEQVRSIDGPHIWWPLAIGDSPPWGHIGTVKSYG